MVLRLSWLVLLVGFFTACKKHTLPAPAITPVNERAETLPAIQTAVSYKVNDAIDGYYEALPALYGKTTTKYPLLVFIHGAGQIGNGIIDMPLLLNDGVARLLSLKKFPPSFTVNGQQFSFIVLTPQLSYFPTNQEIEAFINYAAGRYRVDTTRIYVSGLSMGGFVTTGMGATYPGQLAAIVPISGVSADSTACRHIAEGNLPVWVFHNNDDPSININSVRAFIDALNSFHPAIAPQLTVFNAYGHDAWTSAIDPSYRENGLNIYEWMLQYHR